MRKINQQLQDEIRHRQQAELTLRESELKYHQLVDCLNVGFIVHAPNTQILQGNTTACELLGLSIQQLLGKEAIDPAWHFVRADGTVMSVEEFPVNRVLSTQKPLDNYVLGVNRPNQSRVWVLVTAFPEFDLNHQLSQVIVTFIDITDLKRAETELRETAEVMENAISGISKLDLQGRYLYVNKAYADLAGYPPEAMIEMPWEQTVHPSDLERMKNAYEQMRQEGKVEVEAKGIRQDGSSYYKQLVMISSFNEQQQFSGHYCFVKDISDRKQAEVELRHQKEMFQAIVNHIPVMVALFNDRGIIELINPELERTLGWSLQEWQQPNILSDGYSDLTYRQIVADRMLKATGNWQDLTALNAESQSLETSWASVRLSSGYFLGIGQDISDRKHKEIALQQAMEAAEAANLAKSMFLANMSHELRTPLNVILGFAQMMGRDPALTSQQREDLQTIQRSGDHLLSLINDILDLSKIEAGHCVIEEKGFDLISMLHALRTMMTERAKAKHLQLSFEIAPEVPQFAIADEQKLRQILLNLLSNAIKFTQQGTVKLRVTRINASGLPNAVQTLQFEIMDTGVGIAEKDREIVFDAFVQAEAGRKSINGTGLGLTISRKLLELMHGKISVCSTLGLGSTFTVTVPVYPSSGIDLQSTQGDRTVIGLVPGQPQHRILIVDDQPENRRLIVRLIGQLGLEVQEADNGREAVEIWQQWQPNLIWMDIRMPELDGYEATRQIRAMEQAKTSIIIALTAQASQSDRTLALAAGCNDYISKPFREETLFLKMAEYLNLHYLYAESSPLPGTLTALSNPAHQEEPGRLTLPDDLSTLPQAWLNQLENAAACGDDWAIITLTQQLPSELTQFADNLTELANQFQFEQILDLLHSQSLV